MAVLPDHINGYLKVDNDVFVYNISDYVVTLDPAYSDYDKQYEVLKRIKDHNTESSEYLYGSYNGFQIAILRNTSFNTSLFGNDFSVRFATPLIIKSVGNAEGFFSKLTEKWDKFHAISFYGGSINAVFSPQTAVTRSKDEETMEDCVSDIKIRSYNDYTHTVNCLIGEEKCTITISVFLHPEKNSSITASYSIGELDSFIRFSFEKAQAFESVEKYYVIAKSLIAILTTQNNIHFNVSLSQRSFDGKYYKTANCYFYDRYSNLSSRKHYNVIPILQIWDHIQVLLEKIESGSIKPILDILPSDNKDLKRISITNVQDVCTALETVYNFKRAKEKKARTKDNDITELKRRIKETIEEFIKSHPNIDVNKQTTISSAFQYLDYTLKDKILTLYMENDEAINALTAFYGLPTLNQDIISSFVKLRNKKTHSGAFEWGNNAQYYRVFLALVYAEFLQCIELQAADIKNILLQVF